MELPEGYATDRQPDDFDRGLDAYRARLHMARALILVALALLTTLTVTWLNSLDQFEGIVQ